MAAAAAAALMLATFDAVYDDGAGGFGTRVRTQEDIDRENIDYGPTFLKMWMNGKVRLNSAKGIDFFEPFISGGNGTTRIGQTYSPNTTSTHLVLRGHDHHGLRMRD